MWFKEIIKSDAKPMQSTFPELSAGWKRRKIHKGKKSKENFSIEFLAYETDIMSFCGHPVCTAGKEEGALKNIWGTVFLSLKEEFSFTFPL